MVQKVCRGMLRGKMLARSPDLAGWRCQPRLRRASASLGFAVRPKPARDPEAAPQGSSPPLACKLTSFVMPLGIQRGSRKVLVRLALQVLPRGGGSCPRNCLTSKRPFFWQCKMVVRRLRLERSQVSSTQPRRVLHAWPLIFECRC